MFFFFFFEPLLFYSSLRADLLAELVDPVFFVFRRIHWDGGGGCVLLTGNTWNASGMAEILNVSPLKIHHEKLPV